MQRRCYGARLAPLTFLLAPFRSRTGGTLGCGVNVTHPTRHAQRLALPLGRGDVQRMEKQNVGPPNAVVARARYVHNKKSEFLIMLLDRRKCGATRSSRCGDGHNWRDDGSWSGRESRLPLILAAPCSPTQEEEGSALGQLLTCPSLLSSPCYNIHRSISPL